MHFLTFLPHHFVIFTVLLLSENLCVEQFWVNMVIELMSLHICLMSSRWVSVVEFHDPTLSIGKVFGQESTVVKWNYRILSLHLVTVRQKVPILDFQSEFSMSKIIWIFLKKNFIEEYQFRHTFFVKSVFCWLQF